MRGNRVDDEVPERPGATSTLSDVQRRQVRRLLQPLCFVAPHAAAKLRKDLCFVGPSVILFESRPRFDAPADWIEEPVAKFVYVKRTNVWRLFCQRRDLRWHRYAPLPEAHELGPLVAEVSRDPTGIFWG